MGILEAIKDKQLVEIEQKLRNSFSKIKVELEDHLHAINENTDELKTQDDRLSEIDAKIENLNEKIEELHLMVTQLTYCPYFYLNKQEQKIFLVLYAVEETPLSYGDVARRLNMTDLIVKAHIFGMISKGVPIRERVIDGLSYFKLDKKFKEKQAKEKIVKIDESVLQEIQVSTLNTHF